jgi:hypothetical protein
MELMKEQTWLLQGPKHYKVHVILRTLWKGLLLTATLTLQKKKLRHREITHPIHKDTTSEQQSWNWSPKGSAGESMVLQQSQSASCEDPEAEPS